MKNYTPPAMTAKPQERTPLPAAYKPPNGMTLIDLVAKDARKAEQSCAQAAGPGEYERKD